METKKETIVPAKEKIPESPQPGKTPLTREPRIPESPENNPPKPLPEKVVPPAPKEEPHTTAVGLHDTVVVKVVSPEPVAVKPSWDKPITVVAAIIQRGNSVLISQRKSDEWSAGKWEFPGGKIEKDESEANAIRREMREELGVDGDVKLVHEVNHQYPGCAPTKLKYYRVLRLFGEPYGAEGQEIRWVPIPQLHDWNLLDADRLMLGELERGHI